MPRFISGACVAFLLFTTHPQRNSFTKYKAVEAYEVEPGILAFPSYTADEQVCEIGIEPRHYSPEGTNLDLSLSREEIDKAVDELAPLAMRGQKSDRLRKDLIVEAGRGMVTVVEYENVAVQIVSAMIGDTSKKKTVTTVAVLIQWKNRKCK